MYDVNTPLWKTRYNARQSLINENTDTEPKSILSGLGAKVQELVFRRHTVPEIQKIILDEFESRLSTSGFNLKPQFLNKIRALLTREKNDFGGPIRAREIRRTLDAWDESFYKIIKQNSLGKYADEMRMYKDQSVFRRLYRELIEEFGQKDVKASNIELDPEQLTAAKDKAIQYLNDDEVVAKVKFTDPEFIKKAQDAFAKVTSFGALMFLVGRFMQASERLNT